MTVYSDVSLIKYDDLINDRESYTSILCTELEITHVTSAWDWVGGVILTGDSGRSRNVAETRPRRQIPENVVEMRKNSASYEVFRKQPDYVP